MIPFSPFLFPFLHFLDILFSPSIDQTSFFDSFDRVLANMRRLDTDSSDEELIGKMLQIPSHTYDCLIRELCEMIANTLNLAELVEFKDIVVGKN